MNAGEIRAEPRPSGARLVRILGAIGRACITVGVLILLFVAYQLWGTGIREAQAQDRLEDDFAEVLEEAEATLDPPSSTTSAGEPVTVPTVPAALEGKPTARIQIPKIGAVDSRRHHSAGLSALAGIGGVDLVRVGFGKVAVAGTLAAPPPPDRERNAGGDHDAATEGKAGCADGDASGEQER